jgi:hypothetical protein
VVDGHAEGGRVSDVVQYFSHDLPCPCVDQYPFAFHDLLVVEVADEGFAFGHATFAADCYVEVFVQAACGTDQLVYVQFCLDGRHGFRVGCGC